MKYVLLTLYVCLCTSCSITKSTYVQEVSLSLESRPHSQEVQYVTKCPNMFAIRMGTVRVSGNRHSSFDDLLCKAKKIAAQKGGDFILKASDGTFINSLTGTYGMNSPWVEFSIWKFTQAQTGLIVDNTHRIITFNLKSDAIEQGLRVGDLILGIDDYNMNDDSFYQHLLTIKPGDRLKIEYIRDTKKAISHITAIRNR